MKHKRIDPAIISGDYQYKAITKGNSVQRFWHYAKQLAIMKFMPPESTDSIIDVGCGSGVITSFLGICGATVLGIDTSFDAIQFATDKFSKPNVKFKLADINDNFRVEREVDKIYCIELIEHIYIDQAKDMLKKFHDFLKPGGRIFLTTPNYRSMWPLIEWGMDKLSLSPPLCGHQHVEFYNKKKLVELCAEMNFQIDLTSSTCLIAPWLAIFGWKLSEKINSIEYNFPFTIGSILVCVVSK